MQIAKLKKCHNECGSGWCCTNEFFVDSVDRFDKASLELHSFKGIEVRRFPLGDARRSAYVIVKVPVTCKQMTLKGCKLKNKRPMMCKTFPTSEYANWVLTKKCVFYDKTKHWDWYELDKYIPEE